MNPLCSRHPAPRLHLAWILPLLLLTSGCQYGRDRLYDITDVVDLKYGCGWNSIGIGLKAEVTDYVGAGAGLGRYEWVAESYGRLRVEAPSDFLHFVFAGYDGEPLIEHVPSGEREMRAGSAFYALGINCCQELRPPMIDRFRIGAEVLFFNVLGGLYLNTGELVDFAAGIATFDIAGDDGLPLDTPIDLYPYTSPIVVP